MTAPERIDRPASERFGSYAGPATRLVAWIVDLFVSHALFALFTLTVVVVVDLFTGKTVHIQVPAAASASADAVWLFLYYFISWATVGKTPGMTLIGLRVVRRDGSKLHAGKAAIRTLVFPLSFILFGLGFVGIVVGREQRSPGRLRWR